MAGQDRKDRIPAPRAIGAEAGEQIAKALTAGLLTWDRTAAGLEELNVTDALRDVARAGFAIATAIEHLAQAQAAAERLAADGRR